MDRVVSSSSTELSFFAELALDCVHRPYPYHLHHEMRGDEDALPPRELTPAFYGCYDWHSAVHGHWLLARFSRVCPPSATVARARAALERSLTSENLARELVYLSSRPGFERPYGLAWLLALHAELGTWGDAAAHRWAGNLAPLAQLASGRFREWLPKLSHPVRSGVHSQTAFSLGLVLDWARARGESDLAALIERRTRDHHGDDRDLPLHLEPSGEDFLSPSLSAADLVRRVLSPEELSAWLDRALPELPTDGSVDWLEPPVVSDPADGRLAHLDGLNLSRAWMLEGLAAALDEGDERVPSLAGAAARHREAGLREVSAEHYAGGHWLGTFAVYLLTGGVTRGAAGSR